MIEILEKIEGEVEVEYSFVGGEIVDVVVKFPHYRGIEEILRGRHPLDALVIAPRVCGICGHAHLQAAAMALERVFGCKISKKAKTIREITRFAEIIQNHIKWFYLVIFAQLHIPYDFRKVHQVILLANRLIALFAGQSPHSSYAIAGGVTCDITHVELLQAKAIVQELQEILFELLGEFDEKRLLKDLAKLFEVLESKNLLHIGKSLDRFITLSEDSVVKNLKILHGKRRKTSLRLVQERTFEGSYAKGVLYRGKFYETGPLARMMQMDIPFIKRLHRRYKDSIATRIFARIYETKLLLQIIAKHLDRIDLNEPSYTPCKIVDGKGEVSVEAARGSLIHKVEVKNGKIASYSIITPTQWNLSNGTKENPSLLQKAIIGLRDREKANLVFRSFDICSVCTTH